MDTRIDSQHIDRQAEKDMVGMKALARRAAATLPHVVDLPYRLSSWALDDPANLRLWEQDGRPVAWAALQTPFWHIDIAIEPSAEVGLRREVLAWSEARAREILSTPYGRPLWFVAVPRGATALISELEASGFVDQEHAPEDPYSEVMLVRTAAQVVPEEPLPAGFTLRPLAGADEVEAYVALHQAVFESKNMTVEWRERTLRQPAYRPDLDLVAVAPDGQLAAFCIGWLDRDHPDGPTGQIEPLGVMEACRKLGLGRAILLEGLRRLHAAGAEQVRVQTDNFRDGAIRLYETAGFERAYDILVFRKDYEQGY